MTHSLPAEPITTARLILTPMSGTVTRAVVAGDWAEAERLIGSPFPLEWRGDGWQWLAAQATLGDADARYVEWGTRLALPRGVPGPVLAEVGFHGPPDDEGWAEIGYRVVQDHQRQGLAHEAASALLVWAALHGAVGVKAHINPSNEASLRLAAKLGFTEIGSQVHPRFGEQLALHDLFGSTSRY